LQPVNGSSLSEVIRLQNEEELKHFFTSI